MENSKTASESSTKRTPKLSLKSLNRTITPKTPENKESPIDMTIYSTPNRVFSKIYLTEFDDQMINVKSLGFDANLKKWIVSKKNNAIMLNSATMSKNQLESDRLKLHEVQTEISDKLMSAFNAIPSQLLCKLPDFDPEVYQRLIILNNQVKARIRQTDRKLAKIDQAQFSGIVKNQKIKIMMESPENISSNYNKLTPPEDNGVILGNIDLTRDDAPNGAFSTANNKVSNLNFFKDIRNYERRFGQYVANLPLVLNESGLFKKKSNFQLKKPSTVTSNQQSLNESERRPLNDKVKVLLNTLPTSTVTSVSNFENRNVPNKSYSVNLALENRDKMDKNSEEIIKVKPQDLFSAAFTFNDSEGFKSDEAPDSEGSLCQYPDVSDIKNDSTMSTNNWMEMHSMNSKQSDSTSTIRFIGEVMNDGVNGGFNNLDFPHCREMVNVFRKKFGLHQFRPNQLAAINAAILGYDCFVLMPTGGGKSLCYQLPALLTSGVTIVISPLRSLIIDQTQKLLSLDIPAMYLTGDLSDDQVGRVYRKLFELQPSLKLLYVTPEKVSQSPKFCSTLQSLYQRGRLSRFVIDEVHCVSQWGHDFRPDYKKLNLLRKKFPGVPFIVLTATATQRVRSDILHQLQLESPKWFISSFNRPNLRYSVISKKSKFSCQQVVEIIKMRFSKECGIVYCISRRDCDEHAKALLNNGIQAMSYHAGLEDKVRIDRQSQWIAEKVKVICATIAFGMGIDKPNVRFVLHAAMPKSIEGYYQESGRAGRDGEPADCLLLYSYADMHRYRHMMESNKYVNAEALKTHLDNLYRIVHFCENMADCRRALQLNYFGERFDRQECIANAETTCDNCQTYDHFVNLDVTEDAKALVQLIQALDRVRKNNVTILQVVDIYKGCDISNICYKLGRNYHEWFGRGHSMTKYEIERLLHNLVIEGYLCENMQPNNGIVCAYVVPGIHANELLNQNNIQIFLQKKKVTRKVVKPSAPETSEVTNALLKDLEQRCYDELMEIVHGIAGALDVSANSIMNMVALRAMSQQLPKDEKAMLKIPHVTKANFDKYGKALLDITQKFVKKKEELLKDEINQISRSQFEFDDSEHDSEWAYPANRKKFKRSLDENEPSTNHNTSIDTSYPRRFNIPRGQSNYKRGKKFNPGVKRNRSNTKKNIKPNNNNVRGLKNTSKKGKGAQSTNKNAGPGFCELTKKNPVKKE